MQPASPLVRTFEQAGRLPHSATSSPGEGAPAAVSQPSGSRLWRTLEVLAVYLAAISMAALLWREPLLLAALYVPLSCFVLYRWRSLETFGCFLTGLLLGPAAEFVAVSAGAWSYAGHETLPIWMPLLWGIAVVLMKQVVELVGLWSPKLRRLD